MEDYGIFAKALNRLSANTRSSLLTSNANNPSNAYNEYGTSYGPCRGQANIPSYVDSPHPFAQDIPRSQSRYGDPNLNISPKDFGRSVTASDLLESLGADIPTNMQTCSRRVSFDENCITSCQPPNLSIFGQRRAPTSRAPHDDFNPRGRALTLADLGERRTSNMHAPTDSYQVSGRPFNYLDLTGGITAPSQRPCDSYQASGRPLNLSDSTRVRSPNRQGPSDSYRASGRPFNLTECVRVRSPGIEDPFDSYQPSGRPLNLSELSRQDPFDSYQASGRPFNLSESLRQDPFDSYQTSGRPFDLMDSARGRSPCRLGPPATYHASGRPLNLSESTRGRLDPSDSYHASGRPLNLSDFSRGRSSAQHDLFDSYNTSGRALNLPDFAGGRNSGVQVPTDCYNAPSQPYDLGDRRTPTPQSLNDFYNASGRPYDLEEFNRRIPSIQVQSDSYCASVRPRNLKDFGAQAPKAQDIPERPFSVEDQPRGQYLQVPREQFGNSERDLRPSLQIPYEQFQSTGRSSTGITTHQNTPRISDSSAQQTFEVDLTARTQCPDHIHSGLRAPPPSLQLHTPPCQPCSLLKPGGKSTNSGATEERDDRSGPSGAERRLICPEGTPECPSLSEEQLVHFLQNGDLGQIFSGDYLSSTPRSPLFNILVKDNYYPGAIEDAVNGIIDFNRVAFDAVFDSHKIPNEIEPEDVPMSLLEAFELRIQYEKDMSENLERRKEFCLKERKMDAATKNNNVSEMGVLPGEREMPKIDLEEINFWTHRDELKLASTVDIDLTSTIRDHPETGLTDALDCLLRAERMNDFDKYVHAAEEAIRTASPNTHEKAALKSTCSIQIDMHMEEAKNVKTYRPIEIISYVGTTKPTE